MKHILSTISFSLRQISKAPAHTLLCIFVLAAGIAIVLSMMRLCQIIFFCTVPYHDSDRFYTVERLMKNGDHTTSWPVATFRQFQKDQTAFDNLVVVFGDSTGILNNGVTKAYVVAYVSNDFAQTIGVEPLLGRSFVDSDARADSEKVVIIGEEVWREIFGEDKNAIGKPLTVDGTVRTVVGVMPASFDGPLPMTTVKIWLPLNLDTLEKETGWGNIVSFLGRLREGENKEQARIKSDSLLSNIMAALPDENRDVAGAYLGSVNGPKTNSSGEIIFKFLFICSLLVLLMACAIASGLMTARYSARTQEIAIRTALGASRRHIVGQMLAEFSVIAVLATVLGLLLYNLFSTVVLDPYLVRFGVPPFMRNLDQSWMITVSVPFLILAVTLASALVPALRASRVELSSVLRESTRTGSSLRITRMSNLIIVWQIATACVVLGGGAMMSYLLYAFRHQEDRYNPSEYACINFSFSPAAHPDAAERSRMAMKIVHHIESEPDFCNVALTNELFSNNARGDTKVWIEGRETAGDNDVPIVCKRIVTPGYFEAIHLPILLGRDFTEKDDTSFPVAIITDAFAKKYYGTSDALGKRFRTSENGGFLTIVGIVPDNFNNTYYHENATGFYIPYASEAWMDILLIAKTRGAPAARIDSLVQSLGTIDSSLIIAYSSTLDDVQDRYRGGTFISFLFTLFGICSIAALVMAAAGLFGIISLSVNMRRLEIGIRMAVGESPAGAVLRIVRRGAICAAIGLLVGLPGILLLRHALKSGSRVIPESLPVYFSALALLLSIIALALLIPAISAAYKNPFQALREN
jgi:putative ABC transport system permease protein